MNRRGFTLVELLVALAIFAVVAALAYGGLNAVLEARRHTAADAARLRDLQRAVSLLAADVEQAAPRPVRDEYGDRADAVRGGGLHAPLELTRAGRANPARLARSQFERVAWVLRDGTLVRRHWTVLDRAQDSAPLEDALLSGVLRFEVRFLGFDGEWAEQWPRLEAGGAPRAVEVIIDLQGIGRIPRILRIPA